MLYYRPHRLRSNKLIKIDSQDKLCTLCDTNKMAEIMHAGKTIRVIRARAPYDIFEDLRVNDHLMIVPKLHRTGFDELTDEEKIEHINLSGKYEAKLYNIYTRSKGAVTRSVEHLHTHLIQTKGNRLRVVIYSSKPHVLLHGERVFELLSIGKNSKRVIK